MSKSAEKQNMPSSEDRKWNDPASILYRAKISPWIQSLKSKRLLMLNPTCERSLVVHKNAAHHLTSKQMFAKILLQLNEPRNLRMKDFVVTEHRGTLLPSDVM